MNSVKFLTLSALMVAMPAAFASEAANVDAAAKAPLLAKDVPVVTADAKTTATNDATPGFFSKSWTSTKSGFGTAFDYSWRKAGWKTLTGEAVVVAAALVGFANYTQMGRDAKAKVSKLAKDTVKAIREDRKNQYIAGGTVLGASLLGLGIWKRDTVRSYLPAFLGGTAKVEAPKAKTEEAPKAKVEEVK